VYDADFVDEKGKVVNFMSSDAFRFAHDYSSAFTVFLQNLVDATKSYGAITRITFYPSLVVKSDNGYVIKVKVEILDVKDNTQFNRMFTTTVNDDFKLSNGSVFWAEIATGAPSNGMIIPYENAVFTKIIVK
ncbi:MAG: hypothetical protein IJQ50_05815, partial [Clostridia bacterium]|nr:hypothetical protein [Clostridia bacterium]